MAKINWDEIAQKYNTHFISSGVFKTKVEKVTLKEATPSGSYPIEFEFEEVTEGKLPKCTHWLTFKPGKEGWRQHHMKQLMEVLGAKEDWAKAAIEKIEDGTTNDKIADGYHAALSKCITKGVEVEVECWPETYTKKDGSIGNTSRSEFTDRRVNMGHDNKSSQPQAAPADDFLTDEEIDPSEIPF